MALVPNAGQVLTRASSMWAAYGALALDVGIKVLEYVRDNRELRWQDMVVPVVIMLIPVFRVWQQQSLATATEQQLAKEKAVSKTLEKVATSEGPPITPAQVEQIKREAAWQAQPLKGEPRDAL